jgi:hypothetical protein
MHHLAGGQLDRLAVTCEAGAATEQQVQFLLAAVLRLAVGNDQLAAGVGDVGVDAESGDPEVIADRLPAAAEVGLPGPLLPESRLARCCPPPRSAPPSRPSALDLRPAHDRVAAVRMRTQALLVPS